MAKASTDRKVDIAPDVYNCNSAHTFTYSFILRNRGKRGQWTFREEFRTRCESSPSSWSFEMIFHKVEANGKVFFPATLTRTDSAPNVVDVLVNPQIYDDFGNIFTSSWVLKGEGVRGGDVLEKALEGYFSNIEEGFCFILELRVQIFIFVTSCHSPSTV
ncbi:hypothetical protein AVEN_171314-1 [Araneus ventricosus]|uniref:MATH domain-containing protein n=1 Tax=Araneus ventricosus TaxID=182803 RepID=A0A4Y2M5L8_ARAVE|nr:hypothetical protein AVEN_171314-1 [Araneus ventricosus]